MNFADIVADTVADIDARDRRGYKEGIPMPGAAPRRGPDPFGEMERSLDTGDKEYLPLSDPYLDGTCDMTEGLRRARRILLDITAMDGKGGRGR